MNQTEKNLFRIRQYNKALDAWKEDEHPRDKNGRFKKGAGESKEEEPLLSRGANEQSIWSKLLSAITPRKKKKPEPSGEKALVNGSINPNCNLGKAISKCGRKHLEKISELFSKAPASYKNCWEKCGDKLVLSSDPWPKGQEAIFWKNEVHIHMDSTKNGDEYTYPYENFFHEFTHAIDKFLGKPWANYSIVYQNGIFGKTLREEANSIIQEEIDKVIEELGKETKPSMARGIAIEHITNALEKENRKLIAGIADILGGATNGEFYMYMGHEPNYWRNPNKLPMEAFAEMAVALTAAPDRVKIYKKYFPKSYSIFNKMLEDAANGK